MAREFIDGFYAGDLTLWDVSGGTGVAAVAAPTGMPGTYSLYISGAGSLMKYVTAADEYYMAFRYKPTASTSNDLALFYNGATLLGWLGRNATTGFLEAYSEAATLLATGLTNLVANTVYLIEIHYEPNDAAGVFQVKVDSIVDINFSGVTTGTTAQINRVKLGDEAADTTNAYFGHIVLDNAAWIGETSIQAIVPTAQGTTNDWDPSTGCNFQCVDEVPVSDTDYVSTNVVDEIDLFGAGDLAGTITSVLAVQVQARCMGIGGPTPTNLQLACRTGATNYFGASNAVPSVTPQSFAKMWEVNPNTAAAWLEAGVNGLEIGVKSIA